MQKPLLVRNTPGKGELPSDPRLAGKNPALASREPRPFGSSFSRMARRSAHRPGYWDSAKEAMGLMENARKETP